ncbi:threonine aldolase [Lachnospiraceae bacterium PFB1-22]
MSAVCKKYHLLFYIDGARLGYGLASPSCDFDLPFLAQICDAFILAAPRLAPYLEKH